MGNLLLQDAGSKYGTFVDDIKLDKDAAGIALANNQKIRVGVFNNIYT